MQEKPIKAGQLVLCATPIGNLGDISARVLTALQEADCIAAEDTRNSRKLLTHFSIHTPLISYHQNNRFDRGRELVQRMLAGETIALITDAGTPAISDPGEELVRMVREAGLSVTSLPGASACITALTLSGLSTRRFVMEGFLPRQKKEREAVLQELQNEVRTMVLYESPHHLEKTWEDLRRVCGEDRRVAVCRELTKIHEEVRQTTLGEGLGDLPLRGEFVLVLEGADSEERQKIEQAKWQDIPLTEHLERVLAQGIEKKEAMKQVAAERGMTRREVYAALLRAEQERTE